MDYEKKYKEALGWMQSVYPTMTGATKEDAEHYFPELKESGEERTRKELVDYLTNELEGKSQLTPYTHQFKAWIAWLEKQKDYIKLSHSAYVSNRDVIEFADKYSHTVWEKLMDEFKKNENYSIGCNDVSDIVLNAIINTHNWLEKQGEEARNIALRTEYEKGRADAITEMQKPEHPYCQEYCQGYKESGGKCYFGFDCEAKREAEKQPAWSEEDEIRLNHILRLLDVGDGKKYLLAFGLNSLQNLEKDIVWLKSLKDRIGG